MKNCFKGFFKAFNLIQVLVIAVIVMLVAFLGANASTLIKNDGDAIASAVNAVLYVSLGGVALVGLSNLKSNKMCVIDLARAGGFVGSLGSMAIYLLKSEISLVNVIFFAAVAGVLFVEMIIRLIVGKVEYAKPTGYKAYFANLSNAFNPVLVALLGVAAAFAFILLFKFDGSLYQKIEPMYVGIVAGVIAVVLLIQSITASDKITVVDLLANVLLVALIAVSIYGFKMEGFPGAKFILLTLAMFGSIYARALSYSGELTFPSKIKLNSYYQAVNSKFDYNVALIIGALVVALAIVPTYFEPNLNEVIARFGFDFTVDKFSMYLVIASIAIAAILVICYAIVRKLKSDKIVAFDLINNTLGYAAILATPAVLLIIDDYKLLLSNYLLLAALAVLVIAFILSLIFMFVRAKHYQVITLETPAEEAVSEEADSEATEEAPAEEASEATEEATEEVVEEVVYVDEDGNVIENPEEVIVEEVVEEEVVSDEDLAAQFTEEELAEILGEAPAQAQDDTDENGLTAEELAMLDALPDVNDQYAEEEVVYVDEDGNVIENPEEVVIEEVVEEAPAEAVAESVVEAEAADDVAEEDDDDDALDESDEEDDEDEALEEDALEEEAPAEEAQPEAKEKNIIMPEVQLLDENGQVKKIRRKFNTRMMFASYEAKEYYNEIKNYLVMYRAKGRNSARCETFRYKGLVAKVALAGKSIKVCLAIDPASLEGTKYHFKDVSDKKQYAEVPTMIKVRSQRGLKYFKELVDMMMAVRGVKPKRGFEPTNYLPTLIPNGEAIMGSIGLSTNYLYGLMNVKSIPDDMPDDLADYIPVIQGEELDGEEVKANVYLDTLCQHFEDGEEITIEVLKSLHIVTRGNVLNIKARGTLDRKLIIYAEYFDPDALKMLMCTNCTAVKIIR